MVELRRISAIGGCASGAELQNSGADRARTDDLFVANEALSQAELQPQNDAQLPIVNGQWAMKM
jgi:hypothetical protein